MVYSDSYVNHLSAGPFSGQVDPWAEAARYFHQIHGGMIGDLLERLRIPLMRMGYVAGRETSLQIVERSQPDVMIRQSGEAVQSTPEWSYKAAAVEVLAEPGVVIDEKMPELDAVYIRHMGEADRLVTIVEVVSPSNKDTADRVADYQERRERIVRSKGVNVIEIDLTRSIKRLVLDTTATIYPYHIAVHLPQETSRLIGMDYGSPLKRFALPLHGEVIPVETQQVYDAAYRQASIAAQIEQTGHYALPNLPFPSLLTETQQRETVQVVQKWQDTLEKLRLEPA